MNPADLGRLLGGGKPRAGVEAKGLWSIVEGRVHSLDATSGMLRFTLPWKDGGRYVHGPAPWPRSEVNVGDGHDHAATVPGVGARCLVVFGVPSDAYDGGGFGNPWIIMVW